MPLPINIIENAFMLVLWLAVVIVAIVTQSVVIVMLCRRMNQHQAAFYTANGRLREALKTIRLGREIEVAGQSSFEPFCRHEVDLIVSLALSGKDIPERWRR